ncbi:MAG TPA: hypothetical protein VGL15_12005 [Vicinamibacteria bacterium]|jgi:hypothetical protein
MALTKEQRAELTAEGWGEEWEPVIESTGGGRRAPRITLWRVRVPGGWLCRTVEVRSLPGRISPALSVALAFIPDPPDGRGL